MKYVIISNRLPITLKDVDGEYVATRSGGGLATGLDSLETRAEKHWIGWCGTEVDDASRDHVVKQLEAQNLHPVFLSEDQIEKYYEGYSNSTLWPLCHYFLNFMEYDEEHWVTYREVNRLFCREALRIIEPGDLVWVQDYQLMLLPGLLREQAPDIGIGYFHHIPFPSYEMFRCLPERAEILKGVLGADLVGFHTHDYMRHFISAAFRVLRLHCHVDQVHMHDRVSTVDAFPMGINYALYRQAPEKPEAREFMKLLREQSGDTKIILSVDRLDYSKGILIRLKAYADFLRNNPEYQEKVTLIMVVVPSRDTVPMYAELKEEIDRQTGRLNGEYASVGWTPVQYMYRTFPLEELCAMYHMADVALVTPLRDGMNLVAKEYLAANGNSPGVLILSEMAGAADELTGAVIVNPTDSREIERAILTALTMPEDEQRTRLAAMQHHIEAHGVDRWFSDFMACLHTAWERNDALRCKVIDQTVARLLRDRYRSASRRLLMLDYDGTLAPFANEPSLAAPSPELLGLLERMTADPNNEVVICSGRSKDALERWLGQLPLGLSAEHGAFHRDRGQTWSENPGSSDWMDEVQPIMQQVTEKTPRSFIERKATSLVWHYREVDLWLAELRVSQLCNALMGPCSRAGLQVMQGKRIVEVKEARHTKGKEVERLLAAGDYDFMLAIGDDTTDEDMFAAVGERGITIKVGKFSDHAIYCIPDQAEVLPFLDELIRD